MLKFAAHFLPAPGNRLLIASLAAAAAPLGTRARIKSYVSISYKEREGPRRQGFPSLPKLAGAALSCVIGAEEMVQVISSH